jgi:hypothetical protein
MTEAKTRDMPTADVLSVVTGRLMGAIGGVYEVLNWMTGESLFTHQLPRVGAEARPILLAAHPALSEAVAEASQVTTDNWQEWRDRWEQRYGLLMAVPRMNHHQHERIDPLSEAAEKFRPDQIVTVKP